ncbi:MAG: DUF6054 family protein [Tenericutes bacterium]|jgi:hypothetical protein|nr:DUF6054 family protein [Mycoplasmatota bacterium]
MKIKARKDIHTLKKIISQHYDQYNIINDSKVNDITYFIVVEKFFYRTSNRASLSIVITEYDEFTSIIEAIGSGGGQGWIFKFDWGVKSSFEKAIPNILEQNNIHFDMISE